MNKKSYQSFLLNKGVVGFDQNGIKLKSGKTTHWYCNCRVLSQTQKDLEKSASFVADFLIEKKLISSRVDGVIGVPEGATLLGLEVQKRLIKKGMVSDKIFSLRVKPKSHGKPENRFWTNGNVPKNVIVLEDVTTTGGSALEMIDHLRKTGVKIHAVISLINRLQLDDKNLSVEAKMKRKKLKYHAMSNAQEILPLALATQPKNKQELLRNLVEKEYENEYKHKTSPVRL